jgi:PAS domain S-box-containing protein
MSPKGAPLNPTRHLLEEGTPDNNLPSTSSYERYQSMLNILRGYEEFVLDTSGTILSSNLEAVTITGYEEWEVIGKNISIFYPPIEQLKNKPAEDLAKAEALGKHSCNGIRVKKRESPFFAKMKILAIKDEDDQLKGYRVTLQDATHRVLSNFNVREIKDEYLHLFNNPFMGIIKFNAEDGKVLIMNDKALKISTRSSGRDIAVPELFADDREYAKLIKELMMSGKLEEFEFQLKTLDGTERWCSISCKYFPIQEFIEAIIIDITEQRKQGIALKQINNDLDNFMYHASHDLRAPLSSMMGLVNLLDLDESSMNISECKRMLRDRIQYLDHLLQDMVAISYNNKSTVLIEQINLNDVIKNIVKGFTQMYGNINVEISSGDLVPFHSDAVRVFQILRNVISNAFKFHSPASPYVKIDFSISESLCLITIADNGIGIPPQAYEKLFDLFIRGDAKATGSGLGLYIAKSMVNKLGGDIKVDSIVGKGTSLTISIPNIQAKKIFL